jgi:phage I-like protein
VLDASRAVPEWIHLLPRGEVRVEGGKDLIMDDEAAVQVLDAFSALTHDVVIDYEHQTMDGGQAPAAGWIMELDWREDGLWSRVSWTANAAGYIRAREYRYLSPVLTFDKGTRRITRLVNCALTNQPAMMDAPALVAKIHLQGGLLMPGSTPDKTLDKARPASSAILKELGLEEAADEHAVLSALAALKTQQKPAPAPDAPASAAVLKALGLDDKADETAVLAAVAGLKAPASAAADLGRQVAALQGELAGVKADGLIQAALQDGRTSPAELDAWGRQLAKEHPDQFELIVLKREPGSVVPVAGITPKADKAQGDLDDVQLSINKALGVDADAWGKYGPKTEEE